MKRIQFTEDEEIPDVCQDAVFKALITKETPPSRKARDCFLSAILDQPVQVINLNPNEPPIHDIRDRRIRFDFNVRLANGELANVEMTKDPDPYETLRMEYYLARLYVGQEISGNDLSYRDLKKTWQISLLANRNLFSDESLIHRFIYYDREHDIGLGGRTEVITVELKKADRAEDGNVAAMSLQERWAFFFRWLTDKSKRRLINEILAAEEGIAMAGQVVQGFTKQELELFRRISEEKWQTDMQSKLVYAREAAREEGLVQGLTQGREQGRREEREKAYQEKLETARKALREGIPVELVGKITGLDIETINRLEEAGNA